MAVRALAMEGGNLGGGIEGGGMYPASSSSLEFGS